MTITRRIKQWFPHLPEPAVGLSPQGRMYRLAWISARDRAGRYYLLLQQSQTELYNMLDRLERRQREFQAEARYAEQCNVPEDQTMNHMLSLEAQKVIAELRDLIHKRS